MRLRRRRSFERAGKAGLSGAGLAPRLERELRLERAWREVAGEVVARRALSVRLLRGVLEVTLDSAGTDWAVTFEDLLPVLAARIARSDPALGLRRYRLRVEGAEAGRSRSVCPELARTRPARPTRITEPTPDPVVEEESLAQRLARVSERYLARSRSRSER